MKVEISRAQSGNYIAKANYEGMKFIVSNKQRNVALTNVLAKVQNYLNQWS